MRFLKLLRRKTISVRQLVQEAESIPDWYGIAWTDPMTGAGVCYIMPLHFIARWARLAYYAFMLPRPAWWEKRFIKVRNQAYQEGVQAAQHSAAFVLEREKRASYDEGWNGALAKIEELADAKFGEDEEPGNDGGSETDETDSGPMPYGYSD